MSSGSRAAPRNFFFVQMADPQFGMFASFSGLSEVDIEQYRLKGFKVRLAPKITGFADETRLYEKAIAEVNRLRPDFVVMCGDMVHDMEDPSQHAELMRITAKLDRSIPMRWVAGNHDVGEAPTPATLARYRERFGPDSYAFDHHGTRFVVVNSSLAFDPSNAPDEWDRQVAFLRESLGEATDAGIEQKVVLMHHPLFVEDPDEEDSWINLPRERRHVLLEELQAAGVATVFAGHWHRNSYASVGDLEMVTSGPVGYPLGDDPSGFRIVRVLDGRIEHDYYGFDAIPETVDLAGGTKAG